MTLVGTHKRSVRKAHKRNLDPFRKRRGLTSKPEVLGFKDFKGTSLVRVLQRKRDLFPEFALYVRFKKMAHEVQDGMLKDAGLKEQGTGKWVLRTDRFNIFVYV
jgi:hypothetical protein